jgi:dynein heavy chain
MHPNADITTASAQLSTMFETIVKLLPRSAGKGGASKEDVVNQRAQDVLAKTPPLWEIEAVEKKYPYLETESMNTVLVQEIQRYNNLLVKMHRSLADIQRALLGEIVMSGELELLGDSLFVNRVPEDWSDYPSLMPLGAWVSNLIARCNFMNTWVQKGKPPCFWVSGLVFPQAFFTGTLQNFARKYTIAVDTLDFSFTVTDKSHTEIKEPPDDGVYIHGLFMEGARWDASEHSIADSRPRELYTMLPVMWLLPVAERKAPTSGVYKCPVYKILSRQGTLSTTGHSTNFVLFVELPTKPEPSKWIKAGVALFCALKYEVALE